MFRQQTSPRHLSLSLSLFLLSLRRTFHDHHPRVSGSENGRASAESDEEGGGAAGSGESHDVSDGVGGVGGVAASGPLENGQNSSASSAGGNKARRRRTAFTSEQLLELEREFHAKKYLSLTERSHIAHALKLSEVQVSTERCS